MILSFRPSAGSWLGVLAYRRPCNHASQCGFFISHGVSLWAMKLAVLLRLHHSRHSRQLASCVKDLSSREKRYPILFRNHPGIPDFVNFQKKKLGYFRLTRTLHSSEYRRILLLQCTMDHRTTRPYQAESSVFRTLGVTDGPDLISRGSYL